jgi:hypothetical protein
MAVVQLRSEKDASSEKSFETAWCQSIASQGASPVLEFPLFRRTRAFSTITLAIMSLAADLDSPSQHIFSPGMVTQAQFEKFLSKFDALSFAHRRLENRISELEEDLCECQQALRAERERTQDITHLATQQLQEWTLEGLIFPLHGA